MPFQSIHRIIRGTDQFDVGLPDNISYGHSVFLKFCVAEIPHFFCCLSGEMSGITKIALQFEMTPVVQRIADGFFQRFRPFMELFPVTGTAGNIVFIDTIRAHQAPFVMISAKPDLGDIVKLPVLGNLPRVDVAVIIDNWHIFGIFVKQFLCGFGR